MTARLELKDWGTYWLSETPGIRRITSPYGSSRFVSDHYPVVAELEW